MNHAFLVNHVLCYFSLSKAVAMKLPNVFMNWIFKTIGIQKAKRPREINLSASHVAFIPKNTRLKLNEITISAITLFFYVLKAIIF